MIKSVKIVSGYASDIKGLKDRTFEFGPGLNVVYGCNMSGKTSLLRIAASHCFVPQDDGWGAIGHKLRLNSYDEDLVQKMYKLLSNEGSPGKCFAEMEWDGQQVGFFTFDANKTQGSLGCAMNQMDDGSYSFSDAFNMMRMSAGEKTKLRLCRIIDYILADKVPGLDGSFRNMMGDICNLNKDKLTIWQNIKKELQDKSKDWSDGKCTLILDEPDMSMCPDTQLKFWTNVVPRLALKCQLIIITHSAASLVCGKNARYIEMEEGELDRRKLLIRHVCLGMDNHFDFFEDTIKDEEKIKKAKSAEVKKPKKVSEPNIQVISKSSRSRKKQLPETFTLPEELQFIFKNPDIVEK